MIAREGNQRTDSLAVSNRDRQPIAADIMINRIVKKCSSGRIIPRQLIPVERQNRHASPSNDRIDSVVLFLEIARLPRNRIRTNRAQQVRVLTFLRTQRNIGDMQHPNVGGDRLQRLFEIWFVVAKNRIRQPNRRRVKVMPCINAPHDYGRAPTPSRTKVACACLVGGRTASEFAGRLVPTFAGD